MEEKLGLKDLGAITRKYPSKYRKQRQGLVGCGNYQPCRMFLHKKLALKVITDCRATESCNFKRKVGFNLLDVINTKKQAELGAIKEAFEGESMQTQYNVLG